VLAWRRFAPFDCALPEDSKNLVHRFLHELSPASEPFPLGRVAQPILPISGGAAVDRGLVTTMRDDFGKLHLAFGPLLWEIFGGGILCLFCVWLGGTGNFCRIS
jgi:hypothetical protein